MMLITLRITIFCSLFILQLPILVIAQGASSDDLYAQKVIAITIDDLPLTGEYPSINSARYITDQLTTTIKKYDIPVTLFITGKNLLIDGQTDTLVNLIKEYEKHNAVLQNHGFSHNSYHKNSKENYFRDLIFNKYILEHYFGKDSTNIAYFRAPFNHIGSTRGATDSLLQFLEKEKIQLAPFTIEHEDYIYNKVFTHYHDRGEIEKANEVGHLYLDHLIKSLRYYENLSLKTFGELIPQILLIHSNRINAEYLDEMIQIIYEENYHVNNFQDVVSHSVYKNGHPSSKWGISWIHRWREQMGLDNRMANEPEVPKSIFKVWQDLK